jgi:GT2 family glycosyltransferase
VAYEIISILIATHNRGNCLDELLQRLMLTYSDELVEGTAEILVFDDASSDHTADVCAQYKNYIRHWSASKNVGYIEARRRLIRNARGVYLVSLDDDSCFVDSNALNRIRSAFAQFPRCGILAANIASPEAPRGLAPTSAAPIPIAEFIGCGHVLRACAVGKSGAYPRFLAGYGVEELVLSLRMLDSGYQILFLPDLRIYHAEDQSQRNNRTRRATILANSIGMIVYMYPLWLLIPGVIQKISSHIFFNIRSKSLGSVAASFTILPHIVGKALVHRKPVRIGTLMKFYQLRKAFAHMKATWHENTKQTDPWFEITQMFQAGTR